MAIDGQNITFTTGATGITFTVASGISSGTTIHGNLSDRDTADQHPTLAIAGLDTELAGKALLVHTHPDKSDVGHTHIKSEVGLGSVDNTSDPDKPVSTDTQTALDLKANLSLVDSVDNTRDIDKIVSTPQQAALDLKLNSADWYSYFAHEETSSFSITSDEPAYQEIDRLEMVELDAGTYRVTIAGRVQCDTLGRMAFVRWSLDGGATWEDPVAYNVLDVTDKKPFTHIEIIDLAAGATTIIVQGAKDSSVTSMIINKLDIVCERKA